MTHEEVMAMMAELKIPFAYHHFAEGEAVEPPFACFLYPYEDSFGADNIVYYQSPIMDLEIYTDAKNPDLETAVEAVLTAHELYYEKTEVWIESEMLYEILYEVTL
ncbi:MAG: hypothetical protein LUI10_04630 [Lachnospiraceae bacterium]|nr:hypothetical protein [Lachnospiraceae bacterium]